MRTGLLTILWAISWACGGDAASGSDTPPPCAFGTPYSCPDGQWCVEVDADAPPFVRCEDVDRVCAWVDVHLTTLAEYDPPSESDTFAVYPDPEIVVATPASEIARSDTVDENATSVSLGFSMTLAPLRLSAMVVTVLDVDPGTAAEVVGFAYWTAPELVEIGRSAVPVEIPLKSDGGGLAGTIELALYPPNPVCWEP